MSRKAIGSLLIPAFGFCLLFAFGCGDAREKAYQRGLIHARRGDPKAITDFRKAVDMDPSFYDARLKLAEAYLARGAAEDLEIAKAEFKKCLEQKPDDLEPWLMLVRLAFKGEKPNFSEARRYSIEAIQRHPASAEARVTFANVLGREGRSRESEEVFKVAVSLDPTNVDAVVGLARVLFELSKTEEAEKILRNALTEKIKDPTPIRTLLAQILLLDGDLPGAKEVLSEVPPSETSTQVSLQKSQIAVLEARRALVKGEDAKPYLEEAQSIIQGVPERDRESSPSQEVLGIIAFDEGNYAEAQRIFERLVRVDTKQGRRQAGDEGAYADLTIASYLLHVARCYMELNFAAKARTEFVSAGLWDKSGIESPIWEAITQIEGNDDKAAEDALAKACERLAANPPSEWAGLGRRFYPPLTEPWVRKIEAWAQKRADLVNPRLVLAALAYQRSDYPLCIRLCEEWTKTDPKSGLAHYLRAAALEKQWDAEGAFEALQAARAADPGFQQASIRLARVFLSGRRPDLSAREYYIALQEHPRDTSLMVGLGGA
jgi:tetratricopeptide (TPR) repeat protein